MTESTPPESYENHEDASPVVVEMSQGTLHVNGRKLELALGDDPHMIEEALTSGREEVIAGLELYRQVIERRYPGAEVKLSPIRVMELVGMHTSKQEFLKKLQNILKEGVINVKEKISSQQMEFRNPEVLREEYLPFWQAIKQSGFHPEVRIQGSRGGYDISLWAQLPEEAGLPEPEREEVDRE